MLKPHCDFIVRVVVQWRKIIVASVDIGNNVCLVLLHIDVKVILSWAVFSNTSFLSGFFFFIFHEIFALQYIPKWQFWCIGNLYERLKQCDLDTGKKRHATYTQALLPTVCSCGHVPTYVPHRRHHKLIISVHSTRKADSIVKNLWETLLVAFFPVQSCTARLLTVIVCLTLE